MSQLVAQQITAVATAVLAGFAIVTAVLAGLAFWAQAEQVKLLRGQLDDQHMVTRQQAEAIAMQSQQLELNRQQLAQQQRDLLRPEILLERQQANDIDCAVWLPQNLPGKPSFCLALVTNNSHRPIRGVRCRIDLHDSGEQHAMAWMGYRTAYEGISRTGYLVSPKASGRAVRDASWPHVRLQVRHGRSRRRAVGYLPAVLRRCRIALANRS
jgi:hypothetical protein